jgi:hypothetical protein
MFEEDHALRNVRAFVLLVGSIVAACFTDDPAGAAVVVGVCAVHFLVLALSGSLTGLDRYTRQECDASNGHNIRVDILAVVVLVLGTVALATDTTGGITIAAVVLSFILWSGVSGEMCRRKPQYGGEYLL